MVSKLTERILDELVPRYITNKREADSYADLAKKDSVAIKENLEAVGLDEYIVGENRVYVSRSERQEVDEYLLIETLKQLKMGSGIIKKKEYVDMEKLEDAIYNEKISPLDISKCFSTKEVISLRIGKAKK